ncbi:MAG: thioesterase family protein [Verrucomicrobiota bacterium]
MTEGPRIETEEEVMFFDTDCGGVVHNIAYLRFIETARTRLAALLGLSVKEMAAEQRFAVLVRTEIDYFRPATLGDRLRITGGLHSFDRVRFWCAFEVWPEEGKAPLTQCHQLLAVVQMPSGRPQPLPECVKEAAPGLEHKRVPKTFSGFAALTSQS